MSNFHSISREQIEVEVGAITTRLRRASNIGDRWLYGEYEEYDHNEEIWALRTFEVDLEFAWIMLIDLMERLGHTSLLESAQKDYGEFRKKPKASEMGYEDPYLVWVDRIDSLITIVKELHLPQSDLGESSIEIDKLKKLIKNAEYHITQTSVFGWVPCNEDDVHNRIEGILKCVYPDLQKKPQLAKPIKGFIPDTGIPSLKTFIEYKFISSHAEGKAVLDEIFCDISGYKNHNYDRFVFVIYETGRVFKRSDWEDAVAGAQAKESIDVIVLQGTPFSVQDKNRRAKAVISRSKAAEKHFKQDSISQKTKKESGKPAKKSPRVPS